MTYCAVKAHFAGTYDYVRYRGKVRVGNFSERNDKLKFEKLARKDDVALYVAANLVRKPSAWIGDLLDEDLGDDAVLEARRYAESARYSLREDLGTIAEHGDLWSALTPNADRRPLVFDLLRRRRVRLETVALLDRVLKFIDTKGLDDPLYVTRAAAVRRYADFVDVPDSTVLEVIEEIFPNQQRRRGHDADK
jgi:hypothetical protein